MEMDTMAVTEKRRRERRVAYSVLCRIILTIVSLSVAAAFIRPALSDYYSQRISESDRKKLLLASLITTENARYQYFLGLLDHAALDRPGTEKAIGHYLLSLKSNPTDSQSWIAIAKAYRDTGSSKEAEYAMRKALYLDKNIPEVIWESGLFFLLENKQTDALRLFRRYIDMVPDEQANVYSLCYMMRVEPMSILNNLIPPKYPYYKSYLDFLIAKKLLNESIETWKKIKTFNPERSEYLRYADFLIESGETREASAVWDDFTKNFNIMEKRPSGGMLWNGDFELPIENGGFDWRIGAAEGVRVFRDRDIKWTGFASLSVNFDGRSNPGISLAYQIVPVTPGQKYKLTGYIRTEKITTENGILFQASGHLCSPFVKTTESVTGTTLWKKIDLDFTVPKECKTVAVSVKREQSYKFDSKISGDAWIDSLSMTQKNN